ncbi:Venom serine protease Bi-VSP [Amphibalanus amphitrite]|uniref:Venom serine protease Bi-VSP n=1 Tax=Amphibalanus amphitrite TaxID=1232801 RepID=A0A6A4VBG2_AMPAM|nr:Venom serine protease Bi-VSP [Amphibalanus amphitrite]
MALWLCLLAAVALPATGSAQALFSSSAVCYTKSFSFGVCVSPSQCQVHGDGSSRCSADQICCTRDQVQPQTTSTTSTTAEPPAQLVADCGLAHPNTFLLRSRRALTSPAEFGRHQTEPHALLAPTESGSTAPHDDIVGLLVSGGAAGEAAGASGPPSGESAHAADGPSQAAVLLIGSEAAVAEHTNAHGGVERAGQYPMRRHSNGHINGHTNGHTNEHEEGSSGGPIGGGVLERTELGRTRSVGRRRRQRTRTASAPPWAAGRGWRCSADSDQPPAQRWFCTGALIAPSAVLTAARCVADRSAGSLLVRLGEYDLSRTGDGRVTEVAAAAVTAHPQWRTGRHDLALVRLARPVAFSTRVRPVCLPPPAGADLSGAGAELAGWRQLRRPPAGRHQLAQAHLHLLGRHECEQKYADWPELNATFPGGFGGGLLCAVGRDGSSRDACQGDSGGPLVVRERSGRYQLVGVAAAGLGCHIPRYPALYTRVSEYISWIVEHSQ